MAAGKPHGVIAPATLTLNSCDSKLVLTCLVGLGFLVGFFLVWLETCQIFIREVSLVGVNKSESSELLSVGNFETLELLFVPRDLFLDRGSWNTSWYHFSFPVAIDEGWIWCYGLNKICKPMETKNTVYKKFFDICIQCKPYWQWRLQWIWREYMNFLIRQVGRFERNGTKLRR